MKGFALLISCVIMSLCLQASAANWDSENHTLKVYKAIWVHNGIENEEDGRLYRFRGRFHELYFIQCDDDGNVLSVMRYGYYFDEGDWYYFRASSSLVFSYSLVNQAIVSLDNYAMLARLRNGEMLSASGSYNWAEVDDGGYAYLMSERATVRQDRRLMRSVTPELAHGDDFDDQIVDLIDEYFENKGYSEDE